MNNKNDTSTASTVEIDTKNATAKPDKLVINSATESTSATTVITSGTELQVEVIEFLDELKETVKALNVRRLNAKTLRRSLSNVRDILDDIDNFYAKD
jgi:hypothetical protein